VALPGGSGPRHLAFHPNGRVLYAISELGGTIVALSYAPDDGRMAVIQSVPAVPDDFTGESHCADLLLNTAGTMLYGSNRGNHGIAAYAVDPTNGRLTLVGHVSSGGHTPRNLALDPSGRFLLAANQNSDNIVVFRIDPATGALSPAGAAVASSTPMALRLARYAMPAEATR
jgi:6-phosphogluconolactonase